MNNQIVNPYIESVNVNLFDGVFDAEVKFQNGLNIISGENGTGKTQLIQQLKSGSGRSFSGGQSTERIVVFNPLRNAEKRSQEQIRERLRSQDLSMRKINEAMKGLAINDWQVATYYSFGELFILTYEDLLSSGGITIEDAVSKTQEDFNHVLQKVFPEYEIVAEWEDKALLLTVKKQQNIVIPIESLSRGESEVFALLFNVYANREEEDIYLIDEPEVHLNWDLERGLFRFLDWFCQEFKKQVITTTHSRVAFESAFIDKTQFLVWVKDKIKVHEQPTAKLREKIGGDALQLVTAFDIGKPVFYVEDRAHSLVVQFLAEVFSKDMMVINVNGRGNVQNLCRYFTEREVEDVYFLVDGDNEGAGKVLSSNERFIQLKKYCIENYFLDTQLLAMLTGKEVSEIEEVIRQAIIASPYDRNTLVFKKLAEEGVISSDVLDTFDGRRIIDRVAEALGFGGRDKLMEEYLKKCRDEQRLETLFNELTGVFVVSGVREKVQA